MSSTMLFRRVLVRQQLRRPFSGSCSSRHAASSGGAARPARLSSVSSLPLEQAPLRGVSLLVESSPLTSAAPGASLSRSFTSSRALSAKEYPSHEIFPMPALSPTMEVGTIASWSKAEGDEFAPGDTLCTIETDKASVDFEAQDDGVLAKILRQGDNAVDMPIGTPICVVVEDASDVAAFADFVIDADDTPAPEASSSSSPSESEAPAAAASPPPASAKTTGGTGTSILFPSARHLAESNGLDATGLSGSGKDGRVTKGDVMAAIQAGTLPPLAKKAATTPVQAAAAAAPPPAPAPLTLADLVLPVIETQGTFEDVSNNKMRKIIAQRLTESKSQVPHFYTSMQVELDAILSLRKKLVSDHQVKVSVNDFVIRCCALALRDVPEVNGSYNAQTDSMDRSESIDISVAVATPTGLITPIVFHTDQLGLSEITSTVKDLATRAREGKLAPHEYQGGTFSVSNLGMFGIREFSAVINPPQAAILAVGGGDRAFVPTPFDESAAKQAPPTLKTLMTARLSADRRVVDEATAGLFVSAFRQYMNQPQLLML